MIGALLVDPIVNPIYQRRKQVEEEIQLLNRHVEEMDGKISNFLADPKSKPHPRHLELIEKIQDFRIEQSVTNTHLRALVDRLQWKVHYSKKAWKIFFDNAEAQQLKKKSNLPLITERGNPDKKEDLVKSKAQYSVDTLWEIQKEKLRFYGQTEEKETKSEFKQRMLREYRKLSQNKKTDQKIFLIFDKDLAYCKLDLK
jgi:hypothetical protein